MGKSPRETVIFLEEFQSTSSLVRIIVLKSLRIMDYQSLRPKLGGLLNRRISLFVCRRDMNLNALQIDQMFQRLQ
ncbi:unnamed protein product [Rotaria sp. Silwood2]|nr:unnamed protein product [Rotaria sp. Silwood2]